MNLFQIMHKLLPGVQQTQGTDPEQKGLQRPAPREPAPHPQLPADAHGLPGLVHVSRVRTQEQQPQPAPRAEEGEVAQRPKVVQRGPGVRGPLVPEREQGQQPHARRDDQRHGRVHELEVVEAVHLVLSVRHSTRSRQ
jgi:hypothetical protein